MSASNKDGGPAFPHRGLNSDGCTDIIAPGMTLRDWFAGQVLAGMLADTNNTAPADANAKSAYQFADAMLAARERKAAP